MSEHLSEAEVAELERLEKAAPPGPWSVRTHASGTTNVHIRTGDGFNEYGAGMLYASIILYNQDAYSDGATDDGVQAERRYVARLIAAARNALPRLLAERRALRELVSRMANSEAAFGHFAEMRYDARALLAPQKESP